MRIKIRLDTDTDLRKLVERCDGLKERCTLTDGRNIVNAKSILGAMYAKFEFTDIWLETENEHYYLFKDFMEE